MHDDHEEYLKTILELFRREPRGLSISDISREIGLNRNSVSKYVNMLTIAGKIEMKVVGPAKVYFLSERIPVSAMIEFSSDGIVLLDDGLRIVNANDRYLSLINRPKNEIVGVSIKDTDLLLLSSDIFITSVPRYGEGEKRIDDLLFMDGGEIRHFSIKILPAVFEGGKAGFVVIIEETTERWRTEETIRSALSEKETLLRELHLRVKNNLQLIASLINLQMMENSDDSISHALREAQNRILSLSIVHELLYAREVIGVVDMDDYLFLLAAELKRSFDLPDGSISHSVPGDGVTLDTDHAIAVGLIVNELTTIAIEAALRDNSPFTVEITLEERGDGYHLTVRSQYGHHTPEGLAITLVRTLVNKELGGGFEILPDGWEVVF